MALSPTGAPHFAPFLKFKTIPVHVLSRARGCCWPIRPPVSFPRLTLYLVSGKRPTRAVLFHLAGRCKLSNFQYPCPSDSLLWVEGYKVYLTFDKHRGGIGEKEALTYKEIRNLVEASCCRASN